MNGRRPLAPLGDVTGDGLDDFVVGAQSTPLEGAVRVYAGVDLGLAPAAVTDVGAGFGPSAPAPDLAVTAGAPELGESVTLGVDHVTPHATGLLLVGPPSAAPVPLGAGCFLHLVPALLVPAAVGSLGSNADLVTAPIPFDWRLAGVVVRFQAAFASPASPIGAEVTDAVELLVGT